MLVVTFLEKEGLNAYHLTNFLKIRVIRDLIALVFLVSRYTCSDHPPHQLTQDDQHQGGVGENGSNHAGCAFVGVIGVGN